MDASINLLRKADILIKLRVHTVASQELIVDFQISNLV